MRVTTTEFITGYGALADRALTEPVTITKNGRDRRVVRPEAKSEAELALVAAAKVPAEHAHLDAELSESRHP